ncbi:hypothetical protein [Sphingomonas solaris]|uniref:Uncharacterized protein n=1 Tax=Alterirhizorhabdus solaris TaxID=2529389 RepID=A0A558R3V0_9SPHN|nr:hypothetical protein [Sphingomonas solaris]TVV74063.1 hypothetical protein FOY91_10930 [Sphingomonas solaris]
MSPLPHVALAGLALLSLSACAGSVTAYPSLAPRPIEQGAGEAAMPAVAAPVVLDPAVTARAAALVAQAQRGEAAVETAARGTCPTISRGLRAASGSEAWVAAQQALSVVEAARRDTASARDDIEALVLEQARLAEGQPHPADLSPLLEAAQDIGARDTAQADRLAAMRAGNCPG